MLSARDKMKFRSIKRRNKRRIKRKKENQKYGLLVGDKGRERKRPASCTDDVSFLLKLVEKFLKASK